MNNKNGYEQNYVTTQIQTLFIPFSLLELHRIKNKIMKKLILLSAIFLSTLFMSCEKDNYTPETYIPKSGDSIEKVEKYWGKPSSRSVSSISSISYITYFYGDRKALVLFIGFKVDSYSFY